MAIAANSIAQAFETAFLFEQVSQSQTRLLAENQILKEKISGEIRVKGLIGEHPRFQQALSTMGKVANTNVHRQYQHLVTSPMVYTSEYNGVS